MLPLRIMMVAAEYAPWAKVGGLGDVVSSLSAELVGRGHQVKVVLPLYGHLDRKKLGLRPLKKLSPISLRVGQQVHDVRYYVAGRGTGRLQLILVECESLFGRDGIYPEVTPADPGFSLARASLHAQAALLLPRMLDWPVDVIHAHDAHAAVVPLYRNLWYGNRALPGTGATVLTIHNLAHQEIHPPMLTGTLGLPPAQAVYPGLLEFHGKINLMKAGILSAARLNTVSPTYARETVTDSTLGCDLQEVLADRGKQYSGILNGIDSTAWDPSRDKALPAPFGARNLQGKRACQIALMKELGLKGSVATTGRLQRPLCGFVGRLVSQKGIDLLLPLLPRLVADGFTFALLGTGDVRLEEATRKLAQSHPDSIAFVHRYDDRLARRIYAGCDVFLMPSLFEPCGLSQMYALRYGSPPVVRATGGLADTVVPVPDPEATGFSFQEPRGEALLACLRQVENSWLDTEAWARLQARGMATCFDWSATVAGYETLYAEALTQQKEA